MSTCNLNKKPEISFPCEWSYKIIGENKESLEHAIDKAMGQKAYFIFKTNESSKGKYISITINLTVFSQEEIDLYYKELSKQESIKIVL